MVILVQKSRRPRRWAGVAVFAVLLLALWWSEHRDAARVEPTAAAASSPADPAASAGALATMGPSFASEPMAPTAPDAASAARH